MVNEVKPFEDKTLIPFTPKKQTVAISHENFGALNLYIDFMNESVRSINHLQSQLRFYNIHDASFDRRKKLNYLHEKFTIPLSFYQSAIHATTDFAANYRKSINSQVSVLAANYVSRWLLHLEEVIPKII